LGKAKNTDRINRIDKVYIKNPDNPVENRHEKFFVSGTEDQDYGCGQITGPHAAKNKRLQPVPQSWLFAKSPLAFWRLKARIGFAGAADESIHCLARPRHAKDAT
jgi:hypothetical protein